MLNVDSKSLEAQKIVDLLLIVVCVVVAVVEYGPEVGSSTSVKLQH